LEIQHRQQRLKATSNIPLVYSRQTTNPFRTQLIHRLLCPLDPEGQALAYQWTQVEGDPASLRDSSTTHPSFSLSPVAATSVRRFELVVNDGELDGAPAAVSVTATPAAPTLQASKS
jgi:hypothetical protein